VLQANGSDAERSTVKEKREQMNEYKNDNDTQLRERRGGERGSEKGGEGKAEGSWEIR